MLSLINWNSLLNKAGKKYKFPEQVLTDQGTQFYNAPKFGKQEALSQFTKRLMELGIQHIVASKRRPTTTGKIESFHRYLQYEAPVLEMNYKRFTGYWNNQRPHSALQYRHLKDIYFRDIK